MKHTIVWAIVAGVVISLSWAMTLENTTTYVYPIVKAEIKKVELLKALIPICACESTGNKNNQPKHFDKAGNVLKGKVNPDDIGQCQINVKIHGKEIEKMGLDVTKESDNITFANWLFTKEGSTPWNWSKDCWR